MTINPTPPLANKFANSHPPLTQHCLHNPSLKSLVALLKALVSQGAGPIFYVLVGEKERDV